ncbi:glycosyltransferase family 2 protein [Pseudanabaena biceps]|nr:glycosyltransferase family 2 protein [Pseudanabaena biceps]
MMPLITVITPTTGATYLRQAIESVKAQTYENIQHLIVVDGIYPNAKGILDDYSGIDVIYLPYSTGIDKYNGHKIYGASIYLAKGEFVCFLDEDNWFDCNHIESLFEVITQGNSWAFSFRKIFDKQGNYICNDDCESLGKWSSIIDDRDYLVDVNCFFLSKKIALQTSQIWYRRAKEVGVAAPDRALTYVLRENKLRYDTNQEYTLNYRAGNTENSVKEDFFIKGNKKMLKKYNGKLPWHKEDQKA